MSQLTKKAIAESFIKLVNEMPFDKITVKDIVEDCGVNRNTFYYHYSDIYALLEEIFENEAARVLSIDKSYDSWKDGFLEACSFALQNRKGIYHIYNSVSRRQIDTYLYRVTGKIMLDFIQKQPEIRGVPQEDIALIVEFYKCALVGMLLQWVDGGMKEDPEHIINRVWQLLDGTGKMMLENASRKKN